MFKEAVNAFNSEIKNKNPHDILAPNSSDRAQLHDQPVVPPSGRYVMIRFF